MKIDDESLMFAQRVAGIRARQMKRTFRALDVDDLRQDLLLEVIIRWPGYESDRGSPKAYIETILQSKVRKIIRSRKREIIRNRQIHAALRDTLHLQQQRDRIRDESMRHDISTVVAKLPDKLAEACQQLAFDTRSSAANAVGFSRNGLNTALARSRELFRDHALDLYL